MKPFVIYLIHRLVFTFIAVIITCYIIINVNNKYIEETSKAFKNSEVLMCHETLIVSDSNWKLVDNHLINNNSAGYLSINKCRIKKD